MKIKDMIGITVGASLVPTVLKSIGSAGMGAIGGATQSLASVGFLGHVASKTKIWRK